MATVGDDDLLLVWSRAEQTTNTASTIETWKRDMGGGMLAHDFARLDEEKGRLRRISTGRAEDSGERSMLTAMAAL